MYVYSDILVKLVYGKLEGRCLTHNQFQLCSNERYNIRSVYYCNKPFLLCFVFDLFNLSHLIYFSLGMFFYSVSTAAALHICSTRFTTQANSIASITLLCVATSKRNYKYHEVLTFGHVALFDIGYYHRQRVWGLTVIVRCL